MAEVGLGLVLGASTGTACGPEIDPRSCSADAMGGAADWEAERGSGPACDPAPRTPLAVCIEGVEAVHAVSVDLEIEGSVIEHGTGEPPISCSVRNTVGELYDTEGELVVPPEWIHWVRIDEGGSTRVIAMIVPLGGPALELGEQVSGWLDVEPARSGTFELSDGLGTWWWLSMRSDRDFAAPSYVPGCPTTRLGELACVEDRGAFGLVHHFGVEIDGVAVAPGSQVRRGDLRIVNGEQWILGGPCEVSDCAGTQQMMAAFRE